MIATAAVARRELYAYLLSPTGYLVAALFLFFSSLVYFAAAPLLLGSGFAPGQPASLRLFFQIGIWVLFLIVPALSMRTVSEELRSGTIETLMTAPVSEGQVVLGKFLGAMGFLVLMLLPTAIYVAALERYGRPDYGELACGYAGLLLVGAAFLASGILASTLTSSQVLAYLGTVFFWLILLVATMVLPYAATLADGFADRAGAGSALDRILEPLPAAARFLAAGNPLARARGFVIGLVDSFSVVYFASITAAFLVAAVRSLGMQRWQ